MRPLAANSRIDRCFAHRFVVRHSAILIHPVVILVTRAIAAAVDSGIAVAVGKSHPSQIVSFPIDLAVFVVHRYFVASVVVAAGVS